MRGRPFTCEFLIDVTPKASIPLSALNKFPIRMASNLTEPCGTRQNTDQVYNHCGFVGNPDLYGIGIRVGIYAQWLAALLSNYLVSHYRDEVHSAYFMFSVGLAVATVVVTARYSAYCLFFAEIFVLVSLFFGGYFCVHLFPATYSRSGELRSWRRGRLVTLSLVYGAMVSYNCWFWFKGRVSKFQPTPCGSAIFLFAKFSGDSLYKAVGFYKAFAILMAVYYPFGVFLLLQNHPSLSQILHQLLPPYGSSKSSQPADRSLRNLSRPLLAINCFGFGLAVVAIELTLVWNSVSGVDSMNSVGQLIAFTVGAGGLVQVVWAAFVYRVSFLARRLKCKLHRRSCRTAVESKSS
jgi:hypothetical protein